MRKMALALVAAMAAATLAGCAPSIEGSVDTVVEQCRELPTSETPNVTVTGELMYGTAPERNANGNMVLMLDGDGCFVSAYFEDVDDATLDDARRSGRLTIKGKANMRISGENSVFLDHCRLV